MNKINVVNKANHAPTDRDFYVGRGSILGNSYTSKKLEETKALYQVSSVEEAIQLYDNALRTRIKLNERSIINEFHKILKALEEGDINLVCYCAPKQCHADVIKRILTGMYVKKLMLEK